MRIPTLVLTAAVFSSCPSAFARIGENPEQCDHRYGEAASKHINSNLESRTYYFQGKQIQVIFYKSESVMEVIAVKLSPVIGPDQAKQFTSESVSFFRGLLTGVYGFQDEQFVDLPLKRTGPHEVTSGAMHNGEIQALCWVTTAEDEDKIKFCGLIFKKPKDIAINQVAAFQLESAKIEAQQKEENKAEGF